MWSILRKRKISGYKFLRQHPVFYREEYNWVDFYIPDFYCNKLKLIIEVDGKIHNNQAEYDKERDQKLGEKGIHVVRIVNEMTEDLIKLESYLTNLISERSTYISQH